MNYTALFRNTTTVFKLKVPLAGAFNTAAPKDAEHLCFQKGDLISQCCGPQVYPLVRPAGLPGGLPVWYKCDPLSVHQQT